MISIQVELDLGELGLPRLVRLDTNRIVPIYLGLVAIQSNHCDTLPFNSAWISSLRPDTGVTVQFLRVNNHYYPLFRHPAKQRTACKRCRKWTNVKHPMTDLVSRWQKKEKKKRNPLNANSNCTSIRDSVIPSPRYRSPKKKKKRRRRDKNPQRSTTPSLPTILNRSCSTYSRLLLSLSLSISLVIYSPSRSPSLSL